MDTNKKMLPIGIDNFEKLREENFYYVDKTGLIRDLLYNWGEVNLFTRPRRFGKSLNMNMLKRFFEIGGRKEIFDGLQIMEERDLCERYMGKFPVISISLKAVNGMDFTAARSMLCSVVGKEAMRFQFLMESERLSEKEKELYELLTKIGRPGEAAFIMEDSVLEGSLQTLCGLLERHYDRKAILLIDEYDVPLAKAFERGYYDQMLVLIRNLFEYTLKTNDSLRFAVLTGCMRISKESIFTGLNNLKVLSVVEDRFDEYFGFTNQEVRDMMEYYGCACQYEVTKDWYDGYEFGHTDVYCPWDVINYCDSLRANSRAQPQNYWSNTSGNEAVRKFVELSSNGMAKNEMERLIAGETIQKKIRQELTYRDMYDSIDHLWSLLFMTGYVTKRGMPKGKMFSIAIPNMEIREIFTDQIMEFFREGVKKAGEVVDRFCSALEDGDTEQAERCLEGYLRKTVSIRDTFINRQMTEIFYHGILLGILASRNSWMVLSNHETGDGYGDILVETEDQTVGMVIEVKYARDGNLEAGCRKALSQIEKNRYTEYLLEEGVEKILKYGIACYKKRCRIVLGGIWTME